MLSFNIGRTQICLEFAFFAVTALFMTLDGTGCAVLGIAACMLHEAAHIAVMLLRGKQPERIRFYAGGIKAVSAACCNDFFVLCAGCAANFAAFGILYGHCKSGTAAMFAVMSLLVGVINLLPVGSLDGARILEGLVLRAYSAEKSAVILRSCECAVSVLLLISAVLLLFSGYISPFAVCVMLFSAVAENMGL